jgi:tRNA-2-methylthio-N6-dimethylallyladenosine synthase
VPDLEIGSDWIAGFPGETDADHEATERFLAELAPAVSYVFKYDPRPGTRAAERPDDVPREVKQERNQRLLAAGERAALGRMRRHVGVPLEVFVEEALGPGELRARSVHGLQVRLAGPPELVGRTLRVVARDASAYALAGAVVC